VGTRSTGHRGPSGEKGNWAIVGGTAAVLGARGQVGLTVGNGLAASTAEDPGNRRINGGTNKVHSSDFSPINAANPASAGEILSLFATDLGPTNPDIDPMQPFPSTSLAVVNSPVELIVNVDPPRFWLQ
jgi:uncharacterized protein (TIGR03437 family)